MPLFGTVQWKRLFFSFLYSRKFDLTGCHVPANRRGAKYGTFSWESSLSSLSWTQFSMLAVLSAQRASADGVSTSLPHPMQLRV